MKIKVGKVNSNKGKIVFVASNLGGQGCPTIAVTASNCAKFRDDYSGKLKVKKSIANVLFG